MKFKVKSASLIVAMVMLSGASALSVNESNAQGTTYKIGNKGPAGGWIFYDKGNTSRGWRYLEAAPADQGEAKWGCCGTSTPLAEGTAVGTGKSNTAAIITSCGESGIAAKVAVAYRGGGKSDWFLPSKDELNLMYVNLKKAGIGGFADEGYWSSSESNAIGAVFQFFDFGFQLDFNKVNYCRVRAVRAF